MPQNLICEQFEAGLCRSCTLLETPYTEQLAEKQRRCETLFAELGSQYAANIAWLPPFTAGDRAFRNRAKFVAGGRGRALTLGIAGPDGSGVDLTACPIQSPGLNRVAAAVREWLNSTGISPYSVAAKRGELKFVHLAESPRGEYLVRFVVRSMRGANTVARAAGRLRSTLPEITVATVNLLPEHRAVLEGDEEFALWGAQLAMPLNRVELRLLPQSFFQTNTAVAQALYEQTRVWIDDAAPACLWDLYCGVGGFALHCAQPRGEGARKVVGVELSENAVRAARQSARALGLGARFIAADATEWAVTQPRSTHPEAVIVNPPRRGIGQRLAAWLEQSRATTVVYSSCNPETLVRDLAAMPSLRVRQARVFDMFPHTAHVETACLMTRV